MPTNHRRELARIKRFDQLVAYLRDEMDWPIEGEDFEDLTFEYTPEELGIDAQNAAKIQEIKRLRPLAPEQPWGIFFVKFEPKRLPVVALRRILSRVVLKQQATANSDERAAWQMADLLFISNYGDEEERRISFAHFVQDGDWGDLPTLKVLGWDGDDTGLHLDDVAAQLTTKLRWPPEESDVATWRATWASAFTLRNREVITTSKRLAEALAELARVTYKKMRDALAIEAESGPLRKLMDGFKKALIHDLDDDGFADMYAQTIAYGLLSARISRPAGLTSRPAGLTADNMAELVPVTNPFLKEMLESFLRLGGRRRSEQSATGIDFDELGINEIVQLLRDANMEAVVRDFDDKNPEEDPVIHFYEDFIAQYDPQRRRQRGVFYTPRPVVSYIVRSVDELLRKEFGLEDGLADTTTWGEMAERHADLKIPDGVSPDQAFVQILDPATGTGTFLVEVIELIHRTMVTKWQAQRYSQEEIEELWNEYVPKHLLPRLHGYELMMAPYAIAHLKIGLRLHETGYQFESAERARVFLTNALEPSSDRQLTLDFLPALAHEAQAVNEIKRNRRFTVVIGNPPYSVKSYNNNAWIRDLLDDFKHGLNETKINLDDDFIKFLRYAEYQAAISGTAVVGMITNNIFLSGITHRRMRGFLLDRFPISSFCNLHGDSRYNEEPPPGKQNENVFKIQQGVTISILARSCSNRTDVSYADVWGSYAEKCQLLHGRRGISYGRISPSAPYFFLQPTCNIDTSGYASWPLLSEWMPLFSNGIETHKDALTIHFTGQELQKTAAALLSLPTERAREVLDIGKDGRDWHLSNAVESLRNMSASSLNVQKITYRPFDIRYTVLNHGSGGFIAYPRWDVMSHLVMISSNLGLVSARLQARGGEWDSCFVTRFPTEKKTGDSTRSSTVFPLRILSSELLEQHRGQAPNFSQAMLKTVERCFGHEYSDISLVFSYLYGLMHSPGYRSRYAELLKIDFPRLPLTGSQQLFRELSRLGGELIALHLLESPALDEPRTEPVGDRKSEVEKPTWSQDTVYVDKRRTNGFKGVPEEVWNFHIGGYQVCHKWLKDRKGRTLSDDDIAHYQKIIVAISETIRIMGEIDAVIEEHGGWPGAFQTTARQDAANG